MELINLQDKILWVGKSSRYFTYLKVYDVVLVEVDSISIIDDEHEEHRLFKKSYKNFKKVYKA